MSYLFQAVLLVFVLACVMLIEVFWSWSNLNDKNISLGFVYKSLAAGGGLVIYAGIDYLLLDYLMLVPGTVYVIA